MTPSISTLRRHWLALAAAAVLLAAALTAGSLFAANDRQEPELFRLSEQLPLDGTEPSLSDAPPAPVAKTEPPQAGPDPGVNQVVPESGGSDPLAQWLANHPEAMGPFTAEDAMSADPESVSWILYQAVYKDVMTGAEAEAFQDWYDQRPSTEQAPELLDHQPGYLERLDGFGSSGGSLETVDAR